MRKFALTSGITRYDLNGENLIWFINPAGLGTAVTRTVANITDEFFAHIGDTRNAPTITGTLYFLRPAAYITYYDFANWLLQAENLVFEYTVKNSISEQTFKRDVVLSNITKTELTGGDWLECPITLTCLTPWYQESITSISTSGTYSVPKGGQIGTTVTITTNSVTNGRIRLSTDDGTFADAYIIGATGVIEYSNDYRDSHILCGGSDASGYLSSVKPFGRLAFGDAFTITVTPTTTFSVKYRKWWRTV